MVNCDIRRRLQLLLDSIAAKGAMACGQLCQKGIFGAIGFARDVEALMTPTHPVAISSL